MVHKLLFSICKRFHAVGADTYFPQHVLQALHSFELAYYNLLKPQFCVETCMFVHYGHKEF